MNTLSPITKYIEAILKRQGKPMSMKWIVTKASTRFTGLPHSKFWNAVHNNCVTQEPRFVKITKGGKTLFGVKK